MTSDERENLAKQRFLILNLVRFSAIAVVMSGFAISLGKLFPDFPPLLGYVLAVLGMFEFFFLPLVLKKSWANRDRDKG